MALSGYGPPYGSGTPTTAPALGGAILRNLATGELNGSRRLDPFKKDYVLDDNGRSVGMSDVQQLVQIAVHTDKGSSAVRQLGQELRRIERITNNFEQQVSATLEAAVQHLVDAGLIEVTDVIVEIVRPSVARARLRWRDLTALPGFVDQETVV